MDQNDINILRRAQLHVHIRESAQQRRDFDVFSARAARVAKLEGKPSPELISKYERQIVEGSDESIQGIQEATAAAVGVLQTLSMRAGDD